MYIGLLFCLSWIVLIQAYHIYKDVPSLWEYNSPGANSKLIQREKEGSYSNMIKKFGFRGPRMGLSNTSCDDAVNHLSTDWNYSPVNYTCYTPKYPLPVSEDIKPVEESDDIPDNYVPKHHCMSETISYDSPIPTHGDHRPLWPIFGEYTFVPPQRWLHNIEHGAVVMLYHPCANKRLVDELRSLVKNCIRKHIITADSKVPADRLNFSYGYNSFNCMWRLNPEFSDRIFLFVKESSKFIEDTLYFEGILQIAMPFALVSWGHRILMNHIDHRLIISFIKKYALHGPEGKLAKEGQYKLMLLSKAVPPEGSDLNDSNLCPGL